METRVLGKTGLRVGVLGFGGAEIGFEHATQAEVNQLLNSALDAGLNVIDTAAMYRTSEELIGEAVGHRRGQFLLFTKCGHPQEVNRPGWKPSDLADTIDHSLKQLRTDHLDVIHLHSCPEAMLRKGEVIAVLEKAKSAGKARFIGYSGDGAAALHAIQTGRFDTLQTSVNIADQEALTLTLPAAQERGMGVIAKRPIANAAWKHAVSPPVDAYHRPYWERLQQLKYDFLKADPAAGIAVALRFTLSVPGVHTAIVGTKKPERWQQNAAMLSAGQLPSEQYQAIRNRWADSAGPEWIGQV
jgi:aryl-alcohol dehydrogenase-like predicted oxidoreductase